MEIHEDKLEAVSESQCSMLSDMGDLQERGALHQVPTPTSAPGFSSTEGGDPVGAGDAYGPGSHQRRHRERADQQCSDIKDYELLLRSPPHSLLHTCRHLCRWYNQSYGFHYHLYVEDSLVYQNFPCPDFSMIDVNMPELEWQSHEKRVTGPLPVASDRLG